MKRIVAFGDVLSDQSVDYTISMVKDGRLGELSGFDDDCFFVTVKGKPIKAKTVGQKKYVDAIERKVRADLEAGVELPGLELAAGKAAFTVTDASGAFGQLEALLGVTGEEFVKCCKVGITELDKLVHQKLAEQAAEGVKQTTKASREWLRLQLEEFGSTKVTAGSIKVKA
jgi:hypothetical protein